MKSLLLSGATHFFTCFGKSYIEKNHYIVRKSHNTVPQPPHVAVLVGEKTVGVVAAVLDIVESAAVDGCSRVPRSGAGECVHERTVGAAVGAAFTHAGKKQNKTKTLLLLRVSGVMKIGTSSLLLRC